MAVIVQITAAAVRALLGLEIVGWRRREALNLAAVQDVLRLDEALEEGRGSVGPAVDGLQRDVVAEGPDNGGARRDRRACHRVVHPPGSGGELEASRRRPAHLRERGDVVGLLGVLVDERCRVDGSHNFVPRVTRRVQRVGALGVHGQVVVRAGVLVVHTHEEVGGLDEVPVDPRLGAELVAAEGEALRRAGDARRPRAAVEVDARGRRLRGRVPGDELVLPDRVGVRHHRHAHVGRDLLLPPEVAHVAHEVALAGADHRGGEAELVLPVDEDEPAQAKPLVPGIDEAVGEDVLVVVLVHRVVVGQVRAHAAGGRGTAIFVALHLERIPVGPPSHERELEEEVSCLDDPRGVAFGRREAAAPRASPNGGAHVARLPGEDVDDAGEGVGAVEHRAGPAHHLDALDGRDGNRLEVVAEVRGVVDGVPVDEQQALVVVVRLEHAAEVERGVAVEALHHLNAGHHGQDVVERVAAHVGDVLRGDDGDDGGRPALRLVLLRRGEDAQVRDALIDLEALGVFGAGDGGWRALARLRAGVERARDGEGKEAPQR